MSTQQQEQREYSPLFEAEEETVPEKKKAPVRKEAPVRKKDRSYYLKRFAAVFLAAMLGFGTRAAYKNSTLFLNDPGDSRYLPIEEYVLYEDGEQTQNVRTLHFDNMYVAAYGDSDGITTSRGIGIGDSWDAFVEAYGDVRYDYAAYYPEYGIVDGEYRYNYIDERMTTKEFDEKYVKSGIIDLNKDTLEISYTTEYMGNDVFYTEREKSMRLDSYYSTWNELNRSFPRRGYFDLDFQFVPAGLESDLPDGGLYHIFSTNSSY